MADTTIEWATKVWNPTVGCTKVTAGCTHCYAESLDRRWSQQWGRGAFLPWTVKDQREYRAEVAALPEGLRNLPQYPSNVTLHPERLSQPLRWKQPKTCVCGRPESLHGGPDGWCIDAQVENPTCDCHGFRRARHRVFVDSMSDLFHEDVPDEFIADVWATMLLAQQHDYLILTKRPPRAAQLLSDERFASLVIKMALRRVSEVDLPKCDPKNALPNVWIGVSVTGKSETAWFLDDLARIHAAVRFVSYEPALKPFDFSTWMQDEYHIDESLARVLDYERAIDWLIVGGESGPKARPFNVLWAESVVEQGKAAGVPVFVKQLGSLPHLVKPDGAIPWLLNDSKGGDMSEWPEALRVRQFPAVGR